MFELVKNTWDHKQPMPDLRLLIFEPTPLTASTLMQLTQHGWGICHVPTLDYLKKNTGDNSGNASKKVCLF